MKVCSKCTELINENEEEEIEEVNEKLTEHDK